MHTLSPIHYILIFLIFCISKLIHCQLDNNNINPIQPNNQDLQSEKKVEFDKHKEFKKQKEQKLHKWIIKQINQQENIIDIQPTQSSMFLLKNQQSLRYKLTKRLEDTILIRVTVFEISKDGMVSIRNNPEKDDFVYLASYSGNGIILNQGQVYISKTLQIAFQDNEDHKILSFFNPTYEKLLIQFSIQHPSQSISPVVVDSQFSLIHNKIYSVLQQSKSSQLNRQHQYKYQFGFYQKVDRHQTDMYAFTIAQLIVILGTSAVQLYCIKNLVDEQLII